MNPDKSHLKKFSNREEKTVKNDEIRIMEKKIALLEIEMKYLTETLQEVSKTINLLYEGLSSLKVDSESSPNFPKNQVVKYEV